MKTRHPLYRRWKGMITRCYCTGAYNYGYYGGRGIAVDDRWCGPDGFANFVADMGVPAPELTLDRINNNGPYSPENCRWASRRTQNLNSRSAVWITIDGITRCIDDWDQ